MLDRLSNTIGRPVDTPALITDAFEQAVIFLLIEAYKAMKQASQYSLCWKETRFTAVLVRHMREMREQWGLHLCIDPESHLYGDDVLEGRGDPDAAPRIDVRIRGAWVREDVYYAIEGKIMVEDDWGSYRASALRTRYVDTGIDNFVKCRYSPKVPRGCIAGYVVQGNAATICAKINQLLRRRGRAAECLVAGGWAVHSDWYQSRHVRDDKRELGLQHLFLRFC